MFLLLSSKHLLTYFSSQVTNTLVVQPKTCSTPDQQLDLPAQPDPAPVAGIPPVTVTLTYTCGSRRATLVGPRGSTWWTSCLANRRARALAADTAPPDTLSLAVTDVTTHVYQAYEWAISKGSSHSRIDVRPATSLIESTAVDLITQQVPFTVAVVKTGKAQAYALAGKVVFTAGASNTGTVTPSDVQVTFTGNQQITQRMVPTCPSSITSGLSGGETLTCTFNFTTYPMNAGSAGTVTATATVQPPLSSGGTVIAPDVPYQFNSGQDQQVLEGDCADVTDQLTTDLRWLAPYWRVQWTGTTSADTASLPARVCRSTTFAYDVVITPFSEELCSNVVSFSGVGWGAAGYYGTHRRELMLVSPQMAPVALVPLTSDTVAPEAGVQHGTPPAASDDSISTAAAATAAAAAAGRSCHRRLGRKVLQDIAVGGSSYYNPSSMYGTTGSASVYLFGVSALLKQN